MTALANVAAAADTPPSRWRRVVTGASTPARLWRLTAALVVLCLVTALTCAVSGVTRTTATGVEGVRLASLDYDAAELYEALNGANASAAVGIGADRTNSPTALARYGSYIISAYLRLEHARGQLEPDGPGAAAAEEIAYELPRYTAGVDAARAVRDRDTAAAMAALSGAGQLMTTTILPTADTLQRDQRDALSADYERAGEFPVAVMLLATATLVGVVYLSVREARRTKRILNAGLVATAILTLLTMAWWMTATSIATSRLDDARAHNATAADLGQARVVLLHARSAETASLVGAAPGDPSGFTTRIVDDIGQVLRPDGPLTSAQRSAGAVSRESAPDFGAVRAAVAGWQAAVRSQGTGSDGSRVAFARLTTTVGDAIDTERGQRTAAIADTDAAFTGLPVGPPVLMALAALATVVGVGGRLREYRGTDRARVLRRAR